VRRSCRQPKKAGCGADLFAAAQLDQPLPWWVGTVARRLDWAPYAYTDCLFCAVATAGAFCTGRLGEEARDLNELGIGVLAGLAVGLGGTDAEAECGSRDRGMAFVVSLLACPRLARSI
jgi:hypothetical protein